MNRKVISIYVIAGSLSATAMFLFWDMRSPREWREIRIGDKYDAAVVMIYRPNLMTGLRTQGSRHFIFNTRSGVFFRHCLVVDFKEGEGIGGAGPMNMTVSGITMYNEFHFTFLASQQ